MAKDVIFDKWRPTDPMCLLLDGTTKMYRSLFKENKVLIRSRKNPKKYITGVVSDWQYNNGAYRYEVKCKEGKWWPSPSEFKNPK